MRANMRSAAASEGGCGAYDRAMTQLYHLNRENAMPRATSTFTIDSWDEQTWDEHDGVKLAKARVTKTWRGDLEGTSTTELLTVLTPVETSRAYFGVERFGESVNGRKGSFVLRHAALSLPDQGAR